jgi:hypothetical protein
MVKSWRWAAALAVTLAAVRCGYGPKFADCVVRCASDGSCPGGLTCSNGVCGRSTCAGNWRRASSGLEGGLVYALAVDPKHPTTVYAAMTNGVFKRTTDRWTSDDAPWNLSSKGLPRNRVLSLAIDPMATTTLYAGLELAGIYKSTDAGASWAPADGGSNGPPALRSADITELTVDPNPNHPGHLFAIGAPNAYQSTDGGESWTGIPQIRPSTTATWSSFAVHPSNGTLYTTATFGGLYKMASGDTTWTQIAASTLTDHLKAIAFDPGDPSKQKLCVAGDTGLLHCGRDDEMTWADVAQGPKLISALAAFALAGKTRWLAASDDPTLDGLYALVDDGTDGQTFSTVPAITDKVNAFAVDPNNSGTAYVGTAPILAGGVGGVYKTTDGSSWALGVTGLTGMPVTALAIAPETSTTLYAGTLPLFRSTDAGVSWSRSTPPTPPSPFFPLAVAVDETDPNLVWASGGLGVGTTLKSTDSGMTWVDGGDFLMSAILASPVMGGTFYAGVQGGGLETTDSKSAWMPASSGLPPDLTVNALAASPFTPGEVWAGVAGGGVYETKDGMLATWKGISDGLPSREITALVADRGDDAVLYAGTSNAGVWETTDEVTWRARPSDLDGATNVTALAISRAGPSTIYAGTAENGVIRSLDGGATWVPYSDGLGTFRITQLVVDPTNPNIVYAGTYDGGVFRSAPAP